MENTPYSVSQGKPAFNWRKWLMKKSHTATEWKWAEDRARKWVTCACGNLCAAIPRYADGKPKDRLLSHYGGAFGFFGAVEMWDAQSALMWLDKIERRSKYLLLQMERDEAQTKVRKLTQEMEKYI